MGPLGPHIYVYASKGARPQARERIRSQTRAFTLVWAQRGPIHSRRESRTGGNNPAQLASAFSRSWTHPFTRVGA
jgi:hypothetical protein